MGGTRQTQADHAFTGHVGVTLLGDYRLSPYLSYSTSFNPLLGLKMADGRIAAPTRRRRVDVRWNELGLGLRWRSPGKNLTLNAALYQINQTNVANPNPADLSEHVCADGRGTLAGHRTERGG